MEAVRAFEGNLNLKVFLFIISSIILILFYYLFIFQPTIQKVSVLVCSLMVSYKQYLFMHILTTATGHKQLYYLGLLTFLCLFFDNNSTLRV